MSVDIFILHRTLIEIRFIDQGSFEAILLSPKLKTPILQSQVVITNNMNVQCVLWATILYACNDFQFYPPFVRS